MKELPQNKTHKTLREKLKKKRRDLKQHLKQKRIKHKNYNPEEKKQKFFSQEDRITNPQVNYKKLTKSIKLFINIYEDDLEHFYELFKVLEQKGAVDLADIEDENMKKVMKKMFKALPLCKKKSQYTKSTTSRTNVHALLKSLTSAIIEEYLNRATSEESELESSEEDQQPKKKENKKEKRKKKADAKCQAPNANEVKEEAQIEPQEHKQAEKSEQIAIVDNFGPSIPAQVRQQISQMFDKRIEEIEKEKELYEQNDMAEFDRIFAISTGKKVQKKIEEVPAHLMAQGSARLGQKVEVDENQLQEYDRIHRPKKLIEEHRELMQTKTEGDKHVRKPFDRERDIVNSGYGGSKLMSNSVFFDFKERMTKPQKTNNFL